MRLSIDQKTSQIFLKNFIAGVAWALGVTLGFALLISLLSFIFNQLGALPVVGSFFAAIVEATNEALENRILVR